MTSLPKWTDLSEKEKNLLVRLADSHLLMDEPDARMIAVEMYTAARAVLGGTADKKK